LGLFSSNYNRPGPGIYKNQPKKKPFFLFWEIFFRKFWQLIQLNLLFCVPVIAVFALMVLLSGVTSLAALVNLPLILLFPFIGGLTMITRNYAREEHAFLLSDFMGAVKKNWAAFLANGIVSYVLYLILSIAITYYNSQIKENSIFVVPFALCVGIAFLFIAAQYYIPVMIITFDLKLSQIYKNALIFAIIGLWRNLLLTVLLGLLIFVFYILFQLMPLTILIAVCLLLFLMFSFVMFLINFVVYPLIDKTMIQPFQEKEGGNSEQSDFKD
jgi:uncharacterized membrane protein YesL